MPVTVFRWAAMALGTVVLAAGVGLLILSSLGTGPIDALVVGLADRFGLSLTLVSVAVSVLFIGGAWLAGVRPGVGTALSMLLFGPLLEGFLAGMAALGVADLPLVAAVFVWLGGAAAVALGSSLMIVAKLGVGAYDAVTLAISSRVGLSVPWARLMLDVVVAVAAFAFGGPIWLGTVALALVVPLGLRVFLPLVRRVQAVWVPDRVVVSAAGGAQLPGPSGL